MWKRLTKQPPPRPIKPNLRSTVPFPSGATESDWFANPMYQMEFRRVAAEEIFGHFRSVLVNAVPQGPLPGAPVTAEQALIDYGRMCGWRDSLNLIDRMITFTPQQHQDETPSITPDIPYERDDNFKI